MFKKIKENPKKSAAGAVAVVAAFFVMLEQTGWALLSAKQHEAIVSFFMSVLALF